MNRSQRRALARSLRGKAPKQVREQIKRGTLASDRIQTIADAYMPRRRSSYHIPITPTYTEGQLRAQELQSYLDYASSLYGGNRQYTAQLGVMIQQLGYNPNTLQPGMSTDYFTIDQTYDPDRPQELFAHIHFTDLPDAQQARIDLIKDMPWSTPQGYDEHKQEIAHRSFYTRLQNMGIDPDNTPLIDNIESIMNSSALWRIINREFEDSEQRKQAHEWMFHGVEEAVHRNYNVDHILTMIDNQDSYGAIMDEIEATIGHIVL